MRNGEKSDKNAEGSYIMCLLDFTIRAVSVLCLELATPLQGSDASTLNRKEWSRSQLHRCDKQLQGASSRNPQLVPVCEHYPKVPKSCVQHQNLPTWLSNKVSSWPSYYPRFPPLPTLLLHLQFPEMEEESSDGQEWDPMELMTMWPHWRQDKLSHRGREAEVVHTVTNLSVNQEWSQSPVRKLLQWLSGLDVASIKEDHIACLELWSQGVMVQARSCSFRRIIKGWLWQSLRWWPPHHCSVPPLPPATLVRLISELHRNTSSTLIPPTNLHSYHHHYQPAPCAIYHSTTRAPRCSTHVPCLRPIISRTHQFSRSWVSVATRTCEDLSQHPSAPFRVRVFLLYVPFYNHMLS